MCAHGEEQVGKGVIKDKCDERGRWEGGVNRDQGG